MGRQRDRSRRSVTGGTEAPAGCMSGVLHSFVFHQFQRLSHHPQKHRQDPKSYFRASVDQDPPGSKGVEAPMEFDAGRFTVAPSSVSFSQARDIEGDLPIRPPAIRCSPSSKRPTDCEAKLSSSENNLHELKTPSLVARLMGLDLLPDALPTAFSSPRFPSTTCHTHRITRHKEKGARGSKHDSGTRSLPDTPRPSSARRSDGDSRLSLQLNKENFDLSEFRYAVDGGIPHPSMLLNKQECKKSSGRTPSYLAKEMIHNVHQSVGRKAGTDITNSWRNRDREVASAAWSARTARLNVKIREVARQNNQTAPSYSPRSSQSECKMKLTLQEAHNIHSVNSPVIDAQIQPPGRHSTLQRSRHPLPTLQFPHSQPKAGKLSCERFTRKTKPLRPTTMHGDTPARKIKDAVPSKSVRIQSQGSGSGAPLVPAYDEPSQLGGADDGLAAIGSAEYRYLKGILGLSGIATGSAAAVALATRAALPPPPIEQSRFAAYERRHVPPSGPLRLKCNRRLLIDLAREILTDILNHELIRKPGFLGGGGFRESGCTESELLDRMLKRHRTLAQSQKRRHGAHTARAISADEVTGVFGLQTERELIAADIGRATLNSLVEEVVLWLCGSAGPATFPPQIQKYVCGGAEHHL